LLSNIVTEYVFHCNRQEHALQLAAKGFALLPLKPKNKTPYTELLPLVNGKPSWAVYRKKPPSAADIKAWFEYDPAVNIGIITGPSSMGGLYVLDLDGKTPSTFGHLPMTAIVKTGRSNGWHYYFTHSRELKTFSFGRIGSLQGAGSYVVAAGSIHPSGAVYEYADGLSLEQIEITPLPDWLADGRKRKKYIPNCKEQVTNSEASRATTPTNCINPGEKDPLHSLKPEPEKSRVRKNSFTCSTFFESLWRLNQDPDTAFKIMGLCGREINRIGKAFTCPIPGHSERKPSAALYQEPGQAIVLNDFHEREAGRFSWPLVDVYASVKVGKALQLKKGERAIWWLRALHEIGAVNPPVLRGYELPENVKKPARKLYTGFVYLMELRQLYEAQDSAPFSWSFASRWCDIKSAAQVQQGMKYLLEHGYLYMKQPGVKIGEGEGPRSALFSIGRPKLRRERS
jgi:hypothetical protein